MQQQAMRVLDGPGHGPVVVIGGPGTGKTTLALDTLRARLQAGTDQERLLLLTPTRPAADRLRDELAMTAGTTFAEPVVRTFSAYSFDVIRRARQAGTLKASTREPRLLSGAEQDAVVAELLAGHARGLPGPDWPEELGQAVGTRGFRHEIREFLDRSAELGLAWQDVEALAVRCGIPEWGAAARFLKEYQEVGLLGHEEAYDPAELVSLALRLLSDGSATAQREQDRLDLLVVDDLQEATGSQHGLVRALARDKDAVLLASPDTVVQGFRGARPDLLRHVGRSLAHGQDAPVIELTQNHRLSGPLSDTVTRVALRIPAATGELGRRWAPAREPGAEQAGDGGDTGPDAAESSPEVDVRLVESPVHRDRLISRHVLEAHLARGVAYDDIAVIVRNGAQVRQSARALGLDGISTTVPPVEIPLRDEAAVRPLLTVLERALSAAPETPVHRSHRQAAADAAAIQALLTGSYGRATTLDVRSLRQALLTAERGAGGQRNSTELIAALLDGEFADEQLESLGNVARPARRLASMLRAAREHLEGEATPATALWAVWDATDAARTWRTTALNEKGLRSDRADRDLDAVMALFQAAERYGDQFPGAGIPDFLGYIDDHDLPMDSLAGRGAAGGRVHVLTPAAAAGQEFDTVIVAGLEEGAWPSTGLRGTLLRSDDLVTAVEHGPQALTGTDLSAKLRQVRQDELRQFVTALSRARNRLHLVAVSSEEETPSSFLPLVKRPHDPEPEVTAVPRARTLPNLVALLRRTVEEGADATAADAAGILAELASEAEPVRGADPGQWWGLAPLSSEDPIVADSVPVKVSPSKVESVLESPLNWFVQAAGGVAPTDFARSLGTLVHAIAEDHPEADQEELLTTLALRWDELQMPENWVGASERARAETMLEKLAGYFRDVAASGRQVAAREKGFGVDLDPLVPGEHPVRLTGSMDRVEIAEDGRPLIVDLKTGRILPAKKDMGEHPQLLTYQAAVMAGALDGAELDGLTYPRSPEGAALVGIGTKVKKASVLVQAAVPPDSEQPWTVIAEAARGMSGSTFESAHEQGQRVNCTHPGICPICDQGRQVTEP